jgi:hypothetical protein
MRRNARAFLDRVGKIARGIGANSQVSASDFAHPTRPRGPDINYRNDEATQRGALQ